MCFVVRTFVNLANMMAAVQLFFDIQYLIHFIDSIFSKKKIFMLNLSIDQDNTYFEKKIFLQVGDLPLKIYRCPQMRKTEMVPIPSNYNKKNQLKHWTSNSWMNLLQIHEKNLIKGSEYLLFYLVRINNL